MVDGVASRWAASHTGHRRRRLRGKRMKGGPVPSQIHRSMVRVLTLNPSRAALCEHVVGMLHLRRLGAGGVFDTFAGHFEGIWAATKPAEAAA
jgi:hypothetical protein